MRSNLTTLDPRTRSLWRGLPSYRARALAFASCVFWVIWGVCASDYLSMPSSNSSLLAMSTLAAQDSGDSGQHKVGSELPRPIDSPDAIHQRATQLMLNALRQCVWGPPVRSRVSQSIKLFDRHLTGYGQYAQAGQGTGKLKMSIRFAAGDQLNSFDQISDGIVIYTYHLIGEVSERSRVDLGRVRERLGDVTQAHTEDPIIAMYLGIGGQAELLRKLCQQYTWVDVRPDKIGDINVWWLTGELSTTPPTMRAFAEIDMLLTMGNRSGLLPQTVRVAIGRGEPMPLWLYRVAQTRLKPMQSVGDASPLEAVIDFSEPQRVEHMPAEMFHDEKAESSSVPPTDETGKYLPPSLVTAQHQPALNQLR